jgi:hypothetical protein
MKSDSALSMKEGISIDLNELLEVIYQIEMLTAITELSHFTLCSTSGCGRVG